MSEQSEIANRAGRKRRGAVIALAALLSMVAGLALTAFLLAGHPVAAPDWLRDRIEQRIAQSLPGLDLRFGRVSVMLQRSGLARVILWDVELRNLHGGVIAQLSDVEAGFLPAPLLRGTLELREAQISGAFVTLTRDRAGKIGLSLGDAWAGQTAPDLPQMISRIDTLLTDPRLSRLNLIEADALTIRYEDLRARRGWTVDGGRLRVEKADNVLDLSGDLALLAGGDAAASLEVNASSPIGDNSLDFGVTLAGLAARDIATQSPALAWLDALDAPISGSLRSRLDGQGNLGALSAVLTIGAGALAPNPATRPVRFDGARTYFTYLPENGDLNFDEIAVRSSLGQVLAEGKARLLGADRGWPTGLWGQFRLSDIQAAKGAVLDNAVTIDGAEMAFKLDFDPFHVDLGSLRLTDKAMPVSMSGDLVAAPEGWQMALDMQGKHSNPAQILSLWPQDFRPKPRQWVADHVRAGDVSDARFSLRAEPGQSPRTYLDLAFDKADVLYNKRLPPVTGASGRLVLNGPQLGVRLDKGQTSAGQGAPLDLSGSTFSVADLRLESAEGVLSLDARGSISAALAFIDNDAWQILRKAGRDASLATGQIAMQGRVTVPLRKGVNLPDIDLDLKARLTGVASDSLVPERSLRADALDLRVSNDAVSISGPVTLDGVRATGRWLQPLPGGTGRVTADVSLTPKALRAFGVDLPDGMVSGSGTGRLDVTLTKGAAPDFALESDLSGLGLSIPQLGWSLPRPATGTFRISGKATKPVTVDSLALDAGGLRAEGTLSLKPGGGLDVLRMQRLRLDNWLDVTGALRGRGAGLPPEVELRGGRADMRFAAFGAGGGEGAGDVAGAPLSIALDSLRISEGIELTRFAGTFTAGVGLQGDFTARVGGIAPISGEVVPQGGRSAFRIKGRDAGDILRAAGVLERVQDGTLQLDLAPVSGTTGSYDGLLRINQTRLQGGTAITALLDAISIVGILDQMNGPGIYFDQVEARFRLTPARVILQESSAVGPSMGISLDGYYDLQSGQMDMQGVLSPVYILNSIGRLIARKGEGLIGFNFNMRGPAASPRISVNPLSVFTPGMFRDIFRRPPPKVSQ